MSAVFKYRLVNKQVIHEEVLIEVEWAIKLFSDISNVEDLTLSLHKRISGVSLAIVVAKTIECYKMSDIFVCPPSILSKMMKDISFFEKHVIQSTKKDSGNSEHPLLYDHIMDIYLWLMIIKRQGLEICGDSFAV